MDLEFKKKLLILYPDFDKVTGPYLRKDGRKHVTFNNTFLSKADKNKTRTLSWPKALVEVREGRLLTDNETADHIDEDFTNDNLSNLQILTRIDNAVKSFEAHPERYAEMMKVVCKNCDIEFIMSARQYRGNQIHQNKPGPFCSRSCSGKFNQRKQKTFRKAKPLILTGSPLSPTGERQKF